jgi:hypothetical protein
MELREALSQISEIRRQMARTEVFRGYRAMPVAFSGLLALAAAGFQAVWVPEPSAQIEAYLAIWFGAAAVSALAAGVEMAIRARAEAIYWGRRVTWLAVEQFVPSLVAGGLLTFVLVRNSPEVAWMLPGLWQVLFGLGVLASFRLLPKATFWVGVWYTLSGLGCLLMAKGAAAFSPWAMGLPFGGGQLLAAGILYWTLERNDGES